MNEDVVNEHAFHPGLEIQDMWLVLELRRKGYSFTPNLLVMARLELRPTMKEVRPLPLHQHATWKERVPKKILLIR